MVLQALYLGFIKVLGHWSEVYAFEESSGALGGLVQAGGLSAGGVWIPTSVLLIFLCSDPVLPSRSCPPWPGVPGAAERGTLS